MAGLLQSNNDDVVINQNTTTVTANTDGSNELLQSSLDGERDSLENDFSIK